MQFDFPGGMVGCCLWKQINGLVSSSFSGPRHILRRTSKVAGKLAQGSLGGEVYALSEMADDMLLLMAFAGPFGGMNPGLEGLGGCESLSAHLNTKG